jgi:hypothetical protein
MEKTMSGDASAPPQKPTLWREFLCEAIVSIIVVIKV